MIEEEYYKKYLYDMLDLVFNDSGSITLNNLILDPSAVKDVVEPEYTNAVDIKYTEALKKYPTLLRNDINKGYTAVKLKNGIIGVKYGPNLNEWYFPELDIKCVCNKDTIRQFKSGYFSIGGILFNTLNHVVYEYKRGFDSLSRALGMHYESYDHNHFILKSSYGDSSGILIDTEGNQFLRKRRSTYTPYYTLTSKMEDSLLDYADQKYEIKKQCTLIENGSLTVYKTDYKRYKVYLKNNTFLNGGEQYTLAGEKDGILLLWHKPGDIVAILENGVPLNGGKAVKKLNKVGKSFIVAQGDIFYKVFNKNGKLLFDKDLREVHEFVRRFDDYVYMCGRATDNYEYAFDSNGYLFGGKGYIRIVVLSENYAQIFDGKEYKIIDKKSIVIHNNKTKRYGNITVYNNVLVENDNRLIIVKNEKLKQASDVKKGLFEFGHKLIINNKFYNLKYNPVLIYGDCQVLCISNQKEYYIYNCVDNTNTKLGYITNVVYNDLFIKANDIYYFPYKGKLLDITDYYKEKLITKDTLKVNTDIGEIQTKDEFVTWNKITIIRDKKAIEDNNERIRKEQEAAKRLLEERLALEKAKKERILANQAQEKMLSEAKQRQMESEQLRDSYTREYLTKIKGLRSVKRIPFEMISNFYVDCSDHLEINDVCKEHLSIIDISKQSFKRVKVSGLNFVNSNANFNPQNVYMKDISECDLSGIFFSPFTNFMGVNIKGTKLSFDNDRSTFDLFNSSIEKAIYDERTTINGMPVEEYINRMLSPKRNAR